MLPEAPSRLMKPINEAPTQPLFRVRFADGSTTDRRADKPDDLRKLFRGRAIDKIKLVREDQPRPGIGGRNHE